MLSVVIVLTGFTIYVGVYSLCLKHNCVYAALIGSLAGAAPPLAGYCAVSSRFEMGALILLSIFSLWQIPHSYAIAIFRFDDYAAASIPVLPVKQGIAAAKKHIVGYILAFTAVSLMPTFGGYTGYSYLVVAAASGLSWLYLALEAWKILQEIGVSIRVMTVNPGFGGQDLIPAMLPKVRRFQRMIDDSGHDILLKDDSGIHRDTVNSLAKAGADVFVAGSAIFGGGDYAVNI